MKPTFLIPILGLFLFSEATPAMQKGDLQAEVSKLNAAVHGEPQVPPCGGVEVIVPNRHQGDPVSSGGEILDLGLFYEAEKAFIDQDPEKISQVQELIRRAGENALKNPLLRLASLSPLSHPCTQEQKEWVDSLTSFDQKYKRNPETGVTPPFEAQALYTKSLIHQYGKCGARINPNQAMNDLNVASLLGFNHADLRKAKSAVDSILQGAPEGMAAGNVGTFFHTFNDARLQGHLGEILGKMESDPLAFDEARKLLHGRLGTFLFLKGEGSRLIALQEKLGRSRFLPQQDREIQHEEVQKLRRKNHNIEEGTKFELEFFKAKPDFSKFVEQYGKNPLVDYYKIMNAHENPGPELFAPLLEGKNLKGVPYSDEQKGLLALAQGLIHQFRSAPDNSQNRDSYRKEKNRKAEEAYELAAREGVNLALGRLALLKSNEADDLSPRSEDHKRIKKYSGDLWEASAASHDARAVDDYYSRYVRDRIDTLHASGNYAEEYQLLRSAIHQLETAARSIPIEDKEKLTKNKMALAYLDAKKKEFFNHNLPSSLDPNSLNLYKKAMSQDDSRKRVDEQIALLNTALAGKSSGNPELQQIRAALRIEEKILENRIMRDLYRSKLGEFSKHPSPQERLQALQAACKERTSKGVSAGIALKEASILESCDPSHRFWSPARVTEWQEEGSNLDLFSWADQKYKPTNDMEREFINGVHYLTPQERAEIELTPKNGKVVVGGKKPQSGKYLYVIGMDGKVFIMNESVLAEKGDSIEINGKFSRFHHSSFLAGARVLSAGELEINEKGKITSVNNGSGHYRPTADELKQGARVLLKNKFIDNDTQVVDFVTNETLDWQSSPKKR